MHIQFYSLVSPLLTLKARRFLLPFVTFIAFVGYVADPTFGLTLDLAGIGNISNLIAGRPFQVTVNLHDAVPTQQFETLGVTVAFDASLLKPLVVTPGAIIPDPLDSPLDFYASLGTRDAQVTFLTFGAESVDRIRGGGAFFLISFMPLVPDSQGELTLSFGEIQQFNPLEPEEPLFPEFALGTPITYAVSDAPVAVPGDYDFDRNVDGRDFLKWQRSFGSAIDLDADGNGDGVVGAEDLILWQTNYDAGRPGDYDRDGDVVGRDFLINQRGQSPSPLNVIDLSDWQNAYGVQEAVLSATRVPEPSSWILISLTFMGRSLGQRRRICS